MTQYSEIFNPYVEEVLSFVSTACRSLGIDFYLAGAVARDYHLYKIDGYKPKKITTDIDIAVVVANEEQFNFLKEKLISTGNFEQHSEPIKLIYKSAFALDLLPCGAIEENGETRLTQPKLLALDMPGFALLNDLAIDVEWNKKVDARVCPLEGIVLLKLLAWDFRNTRTKDLIDIDTIIKLYFENHSSEVFDEYPEVLTSNDSDNLNYREIVSAEVIDIKLRHILEPDPALRNRVIQILQKDKGQYWRDMLRGIKGTFRDLMTPRESMISKFIDAIPECNSKDIAENLKIPFQSVTRILRDMTTRGFLTQYEKESESSYTVIERPSDMLMVFSSMDLRHDFMFYDEYDVMKLQQIILTPKFEWTKPDEWATALIRQTLQLKVVCHDNNGGTISQVYSVGSFNTPYHVQPVFTVQPPIQLPLGRFGKDRSERDYPIRVQIELLYRQDELKFDVMVRFDGSF